MAQKQHKGLRNAGTFLDFLNPTSGNNRDRRSTGSSSSQPAISPDSPASPANQLSPNSDSSALNLSVNSQDGIEHGEEAVLTLTHGETAGLSKINSPPAPRAVSSSRSSPTTPPAAAPETVLLPGPAGQRGALSPGVTGDFPVSSSLPAPGAGSDHRLDQSSASAGNNSFAGSASATVVVIAGGNSTEDKRHDSCPDAGEAEAEKDMPLFKKSNEGMARDKDVKRSTSFKQLIFRRSTRQTKGDSQSSETTSREPLSSESDVESGNNGPPSASQSSPIHVSRSCPSELPLLDAQQQQQQQQQQQKQHLNLSFETSGSSLGSPTEKLSPSGRSDKEEKSSNSVKRKSSKKSPWYSVLSASYKSKSDEFRKYFKNIHNSERLIADYSCALQKDILVQGRMYVTENWLCFYANIFKWETLLTIRMKDLTAITKERTIRLIPNAIQIATEREKYFLTSFMSRDRTFLLLFKVWQNALMDQKMASLEYWTRVHKNYGTNLGLSPDELPEDYVQPNLPQDETVNVESEENEFDESKSQGTEGMEEEEEEDEEEEDEEDEVEEEEEEEEEEEQEELSGQEVLTSSRSQEVKTGQEVTLNSDTAGRLDVLASKSMDEEGEVESLEPKPLHPDAKEHMNSYFNVTVDTFFQAMYNKEHPFYTNFLLHRKHTDLKIGEWEQNDEKDTRRVSYTFHLNNPVGPKTCGVEERQIFFKNWSRPGHSYVVHIEIWQTGVPYADYFYTEARMVITRVSSTSCHVRVMTHLVYKKSPWGPIKGFIERNTESGIKVKHDELDTYARQHLQSRVPVKSVPKKGRKRKLVGGAIKEQKESRPIRRVESMPVINTKTTSIARYLPSWLRTDSRNIMLLICIFLTLLSIVNVSLFLQLQTLEQLAGRTEQDWNVGGFPDKLKDVPQTKEEWSTLLQKQLYYHELEMERWREVLGLCIDLMKKMEGTLQELHTGIKPTRIPDLDAVIQNIKENTQQNEE